MTFILANAVAKAMADAIDDQANAGSGAAYIEIRTGTQPADPDTAATGTLLGTLTMSDPAFGGATDAAPGGLITAGSIASDSSADATGTAGWFRLYDSDANPILDGACSTSGAELNFNDTGIVAGETIAISSMTITVPES